MGAAENFEILRALMYLVVWGLLRAWGCGSGNDCGFFGYWIDFLKLKFVKGILERRFYSERSAII